jgi:bifunctional enzyme CysN/CysC
MTLAAGMIAEARVSADAHGQAVVPVDREDRWLLNRHGSCVVWFTGMSGAGKTTIARLVERALHDRGVRTFLLDGDELRAGLSSDLGFSPADRAENIRRAGEVAKLMADAGLVVLACFISPYAIDREFVRGLFADGEFIEVFVDAPLDVLAARDTKGLYAAAQAGTVVDLSGVSAPYEAPIQPQIRLDTVALSPEEAARRVVEHLLIRVVVQVV